MSRIRSIKPEFWTSEQVVECSTNARLLFIGLWNFCDDFGRHTFSPKQIKALVFPADDFTVLQIAGFLGELEKNDLIRRYEVESKQYLYVTGWKHQRIDKAQPAKFPEPSENDQRPLATDRSQKGREGNTDTSSLRSDDSAPTENPPLLILDLPDQQHERPQPKPKRSKSKTAMLPDDQPTEADLGHAGTAGIDARTEWPKFRDWHLANPKGSADWRASWRTWCGNVKSWPRAGPVNGSDGPSSNTMVNAFQKIGRRNESSYDNGANGCAGSDKPKTGPPAFDLV